jgi:hypothetical protein
MKSQGVAQTENYIKQNLKNKKNEKSWFYFYFSKRILVYLICFYIILRIFITL